MEKIKNYWEEERIKYCFIISLCCGIIAHLYFLVNNINNHDALLFVVGGGKGWKSTSGRWLLHIMRDIVHWLGLGFNVTYIEGLVSIIIVALIACAIIETLDIRNKYLCVFVGGVIAVSPTVAATLFCSFHSVYFMFGVLFMIFGIMCCTKFADKQNRLFFKLCYCILGAALVACSLGIYQGYYPLGVVLSLLVLLKNVYVLNYSWKDYLIYGIKLLIVLIAGYIFYKAFLFLTLKYYDVELSGYNDISNRGQISIMQLPSLIIDTYYKFLMLMKTDYLNFAASKILNLGITIGYCLTAFGIIALIIRKEYKKTIFVIIILMLYPVAVNLIRIMAPESNVSHMMTMGLIGVYLLPVVVVDNLLIEKIKKYKWVTYFLVFISISCVLNYIYLDAGAYRRAYYMGEVLENYYTVMVSRVKSLDGYTQNLDIKIFGNEINDKSFVAEEDWGRAPFQKADVLLNEYSKVYRINIYNGLNIEQYGLDTDEYVKNKMELDSMPRYPDDGSMKIVGDSVFVKIE